MLKDRLRIAKDLRGLSNPAFAEKLNFSLAKTKQLFETDREINENDQMKICEVLNLPLTFFQNDDQSLHETDQIFYRSVARIKAQHRKSNEAYTLLAKKINSYLMSKVKLPEFIRPDLEILEFNGKGSYHIDKVASDVRSLWNLGWNPIHNIVSLCELKGIRVFRLPLEIQEIDALSFFDDESGSPFIFLNTFKSSERTRFDCAHELGHLVMHTHNQRIKADRDNRILETEADQFASEFLMPSDNFRATAPRYLSLDNMIKYKSTWRTSLKAINYKAHKLGLISAWVYRDNSMKINMLGHNKIEPEETHRDESLMIPKVLSLLVSQPNFDKNRMLDDIGISEKDFNDLTFNALEKLLPTKPKRERKLYIVE